MKHIEFALKLQAERDFILAEMKRQKLTAPQLAALGGLTRNTVDRFLDETTFSPHYRTVISMVDALGYEDIKLPKGTVVIVKTPGRRRKRGRR